ncbi:tetratricopeptide repeat protein [Coprobacter fastidiosus]|jgi:tetratricopeptide (TPR) repeat protein|uniref:tetratricopeptide repeat protein n=1 Tax=Coprobacter fastidiosus TaxID=1099853 RepID=UPI00241CA714|nr:tetratricopeptide repeat protein [Coprobacter fastidiosus]
MKRIFIFTVLFLCIVSGVKSQQIDYKATAFNLFLNGKMSQWPWVINKMLADPKLQNTEGQLEILTYYYGLVGHLMDVGQKKQASENLRKANDLAIKLYKTNPDNPLLLGLMSNLTGFQIALSPLKATTLAKGMMNKAKKSIAKGPNDPYVNILYSNILFYMPGIFGGDTEKALQGYKKALQTMEADPELKKNNWMYIQLMVTIGVVEEKRENYVEAQKMYRKVLELYPEYAHVKNVSYPRLLEKMKG